MKCKDCKFWDKWEGLDGKGDCRRYPPMIPYGDEETFPVTWENTWCGEFRAKALSTSMPTFDGIRPIHYTNDNKEKTPCSIHKLPVQLS